MDRTISHSRKMIVPGMPDDLIPVDYIPTAPVSVVIKKPPVILQQNVVVLKDDKTEDKKEVDARNFPVLRGFI